jgi:hypothetical protein
MRALSAAAMQLIVPGLLADHAGEGHVLIAGKGAD